MQRPAFPGIRSVRLPTLGELLRLAIVALLVLAAVVSTQLLPGASAQAGASARDGAEVQEGEAADSDADDRSAAVATDQASPADRSLAVPPIGSDSADTAGLASGFQLSSPSGNPAPPRQLSVAGQDGGQLETQRLEGDDACDETLPGSGPAVCARPIETRAGEFSRRTQPQLSAEQRLLAQQADTSGASDAPDAAARRLGSGRSADLSNDDLAIAAVVTAGQTGGASPTEEEASDIPADATNAIDAILGAITNAPPPR